MSERFSLKDHLFNKESVTYLADLFYKSDNSLPKKSFIENIVIDFPKLELKQRITHIREELYRTLSDDYKTAVNQILQALPPELDREKTDDDFGNFILAPLANYIAEYGCTEEYLAISLRGLRECTKRFSAEDAIRYFINTFPEETMGFLLKGAHSNNYHVRRLSSEGTRPRLPWCIGINLNYQETLPLLDILFSDKTRYVTRSVANHMNDISKINPELVIKKLKEWKKSQQQDSIEMDFIINHSLRTLVKQGNKKALKLLGYSSQVKIKISDIVLEKSSIAIGEKLQFSFEIISLINQSLMIDYIIHYQTATGKPSSKVFKIKKGTFKKGEIISIQKKHLFRMMTTRKLSTGEHRCEIQINGIIYLGFIFTLV